MRDAKVSSWAEMALRASPDIVRIGQTYGNLMPVIPSGSVSVFLTIRLVRSARLVARIVRKVRFSDRNHYSSKRIVSTVEFSP